VIGLGVRKVKIVIFSIGLVMALSGNCYADDICEIIAKQGLYNFSSFDNSDREVQAAKDFLCKSTNESRSSNGTGSVNVVGLFSVGGSAGGSSQNIQSICSDTARFTAIAHHLQQNKQTINDASLKFLNDCVSRVGFHSWVEYSGSTNDFTISFINSFPGAAADTNIAVNMPRSTDTYSCDMNPAGLKFKANSKVNLTCHRKTPNGFAVVFNSNVGGGRLEVPPLIDPSGIKKIECPNVYGWWDGAENRLTLPINQDGCAIYSNFVCGADRYGVSGTWNDISRNFVVIVTKTTPTESCTYVVFLEAQGDSQHPANSYQTLEYNPVGRCGFGSQQISRLNYTRATAPKNSCQAPNPQ
jgi:hypothetical protein